MKNNLESGHAVLYADPKRYFIAHQNRRMERGNDDSQRETLAETYQVSRVTIRDGDFRISQGSDFSSAGGDSERWFIKQDSLSNFTLVPQFTNEMKEMGVEVQLPIEPNWRRFWPIRNSVTSFRSKKGEKIYNLRRLRGSTAPILFSILPLSRLPKSPKTS